MPPRRKTNEERFWTHATRSDGCWLWAGNVHKISGYGTSSWDSGEGGLRFISAHVMAYRLFRGGVPPDTLVRHTCDVRHCVNPEHLILGNQTENMRDCIERGRIARGSRQGLSRMTEDRVLELRYRHARGETGGTLAKVYGISQATVSQITRRVTWRHV
jgi:hypothetical protein